MNLAELLNIAEREFKEVEILDEFDLEKKLVPIACCRLEKIQKVAKTDFSTLAQTIALAQNSFGNKSAENDNLRRQA